MGLASFPDSQLFRVLLTTGSPCAPTIRPRLFFKICPRSVSYRLKKSAFISKSPNMGLSGILLVGAMIERAQAPHCGRRYHVLYSQQGLPLLLPATFAPCPSTAGVPKVCATCTFPDAQIEPWCGPKSDSWGLVLTPALASLHRTLVSADICDPVCRSAQRQQPHRLRSWQKPCRGDYRGAYSAAATCLHQSTSPGFHWASPARLCQLSADNLET